MADDNPEEGADVPTGEGDVEGVPEPETGEMEPELVNGTPVDMVEGGPEMVEGEQTIVEVPKEEQEKIEGEQEKIEGEQEKIEGEQEKIEGEQEKVEGEQEKVDGGEGEGAGVPVEVMEGEQMVGEEVPGEQTTTEGQSSAPDDEMMGEEEQIPEELPPDPSAPFDLSDSKEALKLPFELSPLQLVVVESLWERFQDHTPAYSDIDGFITPKELVYMLKSLLLMTYTPEQMVELIEFCVRPPHPHGHINWEQFLHIVTMRQRDFILEEQIRKALENFDPQHTGIVEREQIRDIMLNLGYKLPQKIVDNFIKEVDISGDGELNIEDVVGTMCIDLNQEDMQMLRDAVYPPKEIPNIEDIERDIEKAEDGSDPRVATCRGRLQTRRCQLNQEINKELRLRAGAENLFKATSNRKLRETVALELSFVNSNLQLLKEQLAELNSSVELYQNDSTDCVMPMIPLGLKETKEVDFREPFKDFIMEHYSEDPAAYEDAISDFMDMRQAIRTPVRSTAGVALLFKYYNQLYFIERRFFPPERSLPVYFEWFDSLTGVPSCQRTVAFEKACVLFNMAGIYTQIGAKQERKTCSGLDGAVDALLRAAGTLRYIHENFTNAPSVDLAADTLLVLPALMTAQARECLFEKLQLQAREACGAGDLRRDTDMCLDLAQESAHLANTYRQLYDKMQTEGVFNYVPYSWVSLVHVKTEYYKALAHQYCALGLLHATDATRTRDRLATLYANDDRSDSGKEEEADLVALGRAHINEAIALYEEALRLQRMCRELRDKEALSLVVRAALERSIRERGPPPPDDFTEPLDAPTILPSSKFQLALTPPDFAQHRVEDLFKSLGPIAIFSAKRHWSAPRLVQLQKHREGSRKLRNGKHEEEERSLKHRHSEKRDRSEDNSTYYSQIIRSDEKYADDFEKKLQRVTKTNGVYINSYNGNYDYHPKVLDYDYRSKSSVENGEYMNGRVKNGREKRKEPLRRVASEYNVANGKEEEGFGFSVRGDAPVVIAGVEPNSLADIGGMREGDFIISIGDKDVKWSSHDEVVRLIQHAGDTLTLRIATPMDKHSHKSTPETPRQSNSNQGSVSAASTASSGSTAVTARSSARRAPSWNPFRRHTSRENSSHRSHTSNVIFR